MRESCTECVPLYAPGILVVLLVDPLGVAVQPFAPLRQHRVSAFALVERAAYGYRLRVRQTTPLFRIPADFDDNS